MKTMMLDDAAVIQAAREVGFDISKACALVQGYPFTVFSGFRDDGIEWPPNHSNPGWDLFRDVRVFGPRGEWHAVPSGPGRWVNRMRKREDTEDYLERSFRLWGVEKPARSEGWACYSESNGARVWMPERFAADGPVFLSVREIVGFDPANGLAGVVDAMICGLSKEAYA